MTVIESLNKIHSNWIVKVSSRLAHGEYLRHIFQEQLEGFFDLLTQAVDTGDARWLHSVLDAWVETRTQTELQNREAALSNILDKILQATYEVSSEQLSSLETLDLFGSLLPIFTNARNYIHNKETNLLIEHTLNELEKTRTTLERLDKTKSDFISIAAHELKTPLTLIDGYATMLQDRLEENSDGYISLLLNGINNGTQRLRQIVDDMIDVSIIDNNLLSLTFQPVWINRLLEMLFQEFKCTVGDRNQTMILNNFPGSDHMIFADGERLYQALRNLLVNAIKYTPDGGTIEIDGRLLPGFIEITIKDTGIGVDPSDHDWIFEKFGRLGNISLHSSSKTKFKGGGPGLGLPITKGILDAHGGAIWIESEGFDEQRCPGTTFHVLIPDREASPDEKIAQFFGVSAVITPDKQIPHTTDSTKK